MSNPQPTGKKSKKRWLILAAFFLILGIVLLVFLLKKKKIAIPISQEPGEPDNSAEYARDIKEIFIENGLTAKEAQYWTAVSAHETGIWTSKIYTENFNLFGMKQPHERETTSAGEKSGYASYLSDDDSIKDIMLWIKARQMPMDHATIQKFVSDMKARGYFEAPYMDYLNAVRKHHTKYFGNV